MLHEGIDSMKRQMDTHDTNTAAQLVEAEERVEKAEAAGSELRIKCARAIRRLKEEAATQVR